MVTALRLKEIAGGSGTHGVLCMDKRGISSCYNHSSGVSQLTQHTLGYFHANGGGRKNRKGRAWLLNNTNMFLFNVRDPIGRLISAFNYHRQCPYRRGCKCGYGQDPICRMCFSEGFSEMVETLQNRVVECSKIGVDALLGRIGSCVQYERNQTLCFYVEGVQQFSDYGGELMQGLCCSSFIYVLFVRGLKCKLMTDNVYDILSSNKI